MKHASHFCWVGCVIGASLVGLPAHAFGQELATHTFERQQLTDVYYSEGIAAGDLNRDGHIDMVYGPYWFAGPDFREKREIYPASRPAARALRQSLLRLGLRLQRRRLERCA